MSTGVDERFARIKEIVCNVLELKIHELTSTSLFSEEHDADSLRTTEILVTLEQEFGVVLGEAELTRMVNLDGVYETMSERAGWKT